VIDSVNAWSTRQAAVSHGHLNLRAVVEAVNDVSSHRIAAHDA
jgi:hypothetical protein